MIELTDTSSWEGFRGEPLLLHPDRSLERWLGSLQEVFQAHPTIHIMLIFPEWFPHALSNLLYIFKPMSKKAVQKKKKKTNPQAPHSNNFSILYILQIILVKAADLVFFYISRIILQQQGSTLSCVIELLRVKWSLCVCHQGSLAVTV